MGGAKAQHGIWEKILWACWARKKWIWAKMREDELYYSVEFSGLVRNILVKIWFGIIFLLAFLAKD